MSIIDFEKKKRLLENARSEASQIHDRMLALAGNPECLKDFIFDNDMDAELAKIIYEGNQYLDKKNNKD